MYLKLSSAQWRPFCLGLNVLNTRICLSYRVDMDAEVQVTQGAMFSNHGIGLVLLQYSDLSTKWF